MALTDLQLKQAAPRERDWKLADAGWLYILIRPNGLQAVADEVPPAWR